MAYTARLAGNSLLHALLGAGCGHTSSLATVARATVATQCDFRNRCAAQRCNNSVLLQQIRTSSSSSNANSSHTCRFVVLATGLGRPVRLPPEVPTTMKRRRCGARAGAGVPCLTGACSTVPSRVRAVWDTVRCAVRDTVPCGIPCRIAS